MSKQTGPPSSPNAFRVLQSLSWVLLAGALLFESRCVGQSPIRIGFEGPPVVPDAVTVHFIGYRSDGSIVTQDFTTDGIIDGTGPGVDFQTFHFGQEFSGLTRVEIPTFGWSLDNLVVVPEPSTVALAIAGGPILWVRLRRRLAR